MYWTNSPWPWLLPIPRAITAAPVDFQTMTWTVAPFEATCYGEWYSETHVRDWYWTDWTSPANELVTKHFIADSSVCRQHKDMSTGWARDGVLWTKNPHWLFFFVCQRDGDTAALACCPDKGGVIKTHRSGVDLDKDPDYGILRPCKASGGPSEDVITAAEEEGLKGHGDATSGDAASAHKPI